MGTTGQPSIAPDRAQIADTLILYLMSQHPSRYTAETLPRDESLLELGVIDSAGAVELLVFVESAWGIELSDDDITAERIGSLNKLAALVQEYVARKVP